MSEIQVTTIPNYIKSLACNMARMGFNDIDYNHYMISGCKDGFCLQIVQTVVENEVDFFIESVFTGDGTKTRVVLTNKELESLPNPQMWVKFKAHWNAQSCSRSELAKIYKG